MSGKLRCDFDIAVDPIYHYGINSSTKKLVIPSTIEGIEEIKFCFDWPTE